MLVILSLLLKLAGVGFLCIAGLGVVRLSDPFQRMHAATKAGTLGAGLVILGTIVAQGATDATIIGTLTIVFLLLTVPVAGHLLGRAAYVSGAKLSLRGGNALDGILERSTRPLDERMGWLPVEAPATQEGAPNIVARQRRPQIVSLPSLEAVRFAVIDGHVMPVAARALAIASRNRAELSAHVVIDTHAIETAEDPAQMRRLIRERAGKAIHTLRSLEGADSALNYDEGDPEHLLACDRMGEVLLVLPCDGWFHHQVDGRRTLTTWEPDGLLRLPGVHRGPVLFAGARLDTGTLVVRDCGEDHLAALVEWALMAGIWSVIRLVHVADVGLDSRPIEEIARRFGCTYENRPAPDEGCAIPHDLVDAAVVLGRTPRPLRTNWFGAHWRSRIAPGMTGDVLVMEPPQRGTKA
jgi:monovalent cation/proton antiporter MnhG/PhaG subunit